MQLEYGKRYVRRDGKVTGPLEKNKNPSTIFEYPFLDPVSTKSYALDGIYDITHPVPQNYDLVSEYVPPEPIPQPPSEQAFAPGIKDEEILESGGTQFSTGAVRSADKAGVMYHLITPIGLRRIAETYKEGFDKYGAYNWERGFPIGDVLNHAIAHIFAYLEGKPTGEDDLAHAAWNLLAAMHMEETHPELEHQLRPNHPMNRKDF